MQLSGDVLREEELKKKAVVEAAFEKSPEKLGWTKSLGEEHGRIPKSQDYPPTFGSPMDFW